MANKPISDNTAFPFETNVRAIAGIAGFKTGTPNTNTKIGGSDLVQSVINGGTANAGGLAVYATSGSVKELATYISLNYTAGTTSAPAVLELGTPSHPSTVQISGNFNGPDPFVSPKLTFLTKNTITGSNTVSIEPSSVATANQSLVLPPAPGTAGQGLKAASVSSGDVLLEWYTVTDDNTTYTFDATQSSVGSDADPFLTLTGTDTSVDEVKLVGGTSINVNRNTAGDQVTIDYTGTDSDTTYDLNTSASGALGQIDLVGSDGTTDIVQLQGAGTVSVSSDAIGNITITGASGGGGGYQTLTPGLTVSWSAGSGLSAELTPSATSSPNTISMTGFSAGDTGALKIIPTTTAAFRLPSNSKAAGGNITISNSNPSILEYFYDGTTFYWWPESNMIDPIYFPVINETGLIAFYVPNTYTGGVGNVPSGSAWVNSFTSNNLIGDLTRQGTDADDVQFVERDDATSTPAHFVLGSDGTSTGYFDRATNLSTTSFGGDWTGIIWVLANSTTSTTSYGALIDGDKDDDEAMYMDERRLCMYNSGGGGYIYSNFPALVNSGNTGNDNAFNLEDEWVYFGLSVNDTANAITFFIGCQATLDNAGSTIIGYDGTNINIDANGLYRETVSTTIGEGTWNDFIIGAASTGSFHYEGAIGMAAVYNQTTDITVHTSNWNNTKSYYYIS